MAYLLAPPTTMPFMSSYHNRVRDAVLVGPTMIIGPPGAGKSTTARMVALEISRREPEVLNCHAGISPSALWHTYEFDGMRSVRLAGQLSRAIAEDRVLIVEDFTQLPVELRAVFLFLGQDHVVDPVTRESYDASRLRVIFTSNPESASRCVNEPVTNALMDRCVILNVPGFDQTQVCSLLMHEFPDEAQARIDFCAEMLQEFDDVVQSDHKKEAGITLGVRAALNLMRLLRAGMGQREAVELAFVNRFLPDRDLFEAAATRHSMRIYAGEEVEGGDGDDPPLD